MRPTTTCELYFTEAEVLPLRGPVVGHVFQCSHQTRHRQICGLAAVKDGADDIWVEVGQAHQRRHVAAAGSQLGCHVLYAVVPARKELVACVEGLSEETDQTTIWFCSGAGTNDQSHALTRALQLSLDA